MALVIVGSREITFCKNVKISFYYIFMKCSFYLHGVSVGLGGPLSFCDYFSLSSKLLF